MTTAAKRQKLKRYIDDADDKKVKALYALFEENMDSNEGAVFTNEQLEILNDEYELHVSGKTKSYNWEETKEIIRGKRLM